MSDTQSKTADAHLRQRIEKIIDTQYEFDTQYEVEDNSQTTQKLVDSTISFLGDCSETGEVFLDQALGFAIEKLESESNATQPTQDAINYGGGLK
ncbi:hypothetical protein [uncultured Gimesia sp.]|uniref:hypothetical protein n=1 Tax=uncultured Gimesia sp. TaxID=1678688 RepID=UPI00260A55CF|nr:hypothetical protein [uncultured Gimesia sp.]